MGNQVSPYVSPPCQPSQTRCKPGAIGEAAKATIGRTAMRSPGDGHLILATRAGAGGVDRGVDIERSVRLRPAILL